MILERPIVFFDLETTGLDVQKDSIIEIATVKIFPDLKKEKKRYLFNPQINIPKEASDVHGLTNEMVKDAPLFKQYAKSIYQYFYNCDIGGFNCDFFDLPLLIQEMENSGVDDFLSWNPAIVDSCTFEKKINPNTLGAVYKRYTGNELVGAHGALADTEATVEVFLAQVKSLEKDNTEELTPLKIDQICQEDRKRIDYNRKLYINKEGVVCWAIGKYANKPIDVDINYVNWVLNSNFPNETKKVIRKVLNW